MSHLRHSLFELRTHRKISAAFTLVGLFVDSRD